MFNSEIVIVEGSERRDRHYITATQTSDFARTFIDSAWVDVDPGERRKIDVFTEFMVGDKTIEDYVNSIGGVEAAVENPNHLLLSSAVLTGCAANTRGGASVLVPVGIRTHFTNLTTEPGTPLVLGSVRTISGAAASGEVIVGVRPVGSPTEEVTATRRLSHGDFDVRVNGAPSGRVEVRAHFMGDKGFASCDSQPIVRDFP